MQKKTMPEETISLNKEDHQKGGKATQWGPERDPQGDENWRPSKRKESPPRNQV